MNKRRRKNAKTLKRTFAVRSQNFTSGLFQEHESKWVKWNSKTKKTKRTKKEKRNNDCRLNFMRDVKWNEVWRKLGNNGLHPTFIYLYTKFSKEFQFMCTVVLTYTIQIFFCRIDKIILFALCSLYLRANDVPNFRHGQKQTSRHEHRVYVTKSRF